MLKFFQYSHCEARWRTHQMQAELHQPGWSRKTGLGVQKEVEGAGIWGRKQRRIWLKKRMRESPRAVSLSGSLLARRESRSFPSSSGVLAEQGLFVGLRRAGMGCTRGQGGPGGVTSSCCHARGHMKEAVWCHPAAAMLCVHRDTELL